MNARFCSRNKAPVIVHGLLLLAALLIFRATEVQADLGPKPSMNFSFTYEIAEIPINSGQLMECSDETCSDAHPLEEIALQNFSCSEYECHSQAYGYADYFRLVIQFSDRVRQSNVFTKKAFNAGYTVTVLEDALEVKENFKITSCCDCLSLWLTLVIETLVASLYMTAFHLPRAFLGWIPLASLVTLPVVWLGFPLLPLPSTAVMGLSEVFAVVVETGLLHFLTFRRISLRQAFLLSLVMNMISFGIGLLI
jgi:hypothetical protein